MYIFASISVFLCFSSSFVKNTLSLQLSHGQLNCHLAIAKFAQLCKFYKFFFKTFNRCTQYLHEYVQNLNIVELCYTRHTYIASYITFMYNGLCTWQPESTESNYSPVNFRLHSIVFLTMQITNTIYKLQIQITNTNHKYNLQIQITIAICKSVQLSGIERIHENQVDFSFCVKVHICHPSLMIVHTQPKYF